MNREFSAHHILQHGKAPKLAPKAKWHRAVKLALGIFLGLLAVLMCWTYLLLGPFRTFFWNTPGLAGIGSAKNYLILLQHENELRPTGGFITSFAILSLHWGIPYIEFLNSEEVTIPNPREKGPEAIESIFGTDPKYAGWVFRDSNFSLD